MLKPALVSAKSSNADTPLSLRKKGAEREVKWAMLKLAGRQSHITELVHEHVAKGLVGTIYNLCDECA